MFDDQNKQKNSSSSEGKNLNLRDKEGKGDPSHGGQKMTDSPFKTGKESQKGERENDSGKDPEKGGENKKNSYPPKSPLADKEEPEDMFDSLDKGASGISSDDQKHPSRGEEEQKELSPAGTKKNTSGSRGVNIDKSIIIKYIILGIIALLVVGVVAFWGSDMLISPTE